MGIRLTQGADLAVRLEKRAERTTRQLRRVHRDGAFALAETIEQMVPYKTGELEGSVEVTEERGARGRKIFNIEAHAPHAVYMNEGVYNLGKGSIAKQETSAFTVGRKFIQRGKAWLMEDWGFIRKAKAAVRDGMK